MAHGLKRVPRNFAHQAALAAGEVLRAEGRPDEALELFAVAIARAQTHGFVHVEGLAHESAARLCHEQGLARPAATATSETRSRCYRHWGATAKVAQLELALPVSRRCGR